MKIAAMLAAIFLTAPVLAEEAPTATVTTCHGGREVEQTGRSATVLQGVALATFGTGQIESKVTQDEWDAAKKTNHIRVQFAEPQVISLNVTSGDFRGEKSYAVNEFLVPTAVSSGGPMARVGMEYYVFGKWDPRILLLLKDVVGIRE